MCVVLARRLRAPSEGGDFCCALLSFAEDDLDKLMQGGGGAGAGAGGAKKGNAAACKFAWARPLPHGALVLGRSGVERICCVPCS